MREEVEESKKTNQTDNLSIPKRNRIAEKSRKEKTLNN